MSEFARNEIDIYYKTVLRSMNLQELREKLGFSWSNDQIARFALWFTRCDVYTYMDWPKLASDFQYWDKSGLTWDKEKAERFYRIFGQEYIRAAKSLGCPKISSWEKRFNVDLGLRADAQDCDRLGLESLRL